MNQEIVWAAGFWDGEGHARADVRDDGRTRVSLQINQKDREVLDRFQQAVGGKVYARPHKSGKDPAIFRWQTNNWKEVHDISLMIMPYLSSLKLEQCWKVLEKYTAYLENYVPKKRGRPVKVAG